jgi:hypothetical protein
MFTSSIDHHESGMAVDWSDDGVLITQDLEAVLSETLFRRNNPVADTKEAKLRHVATIPAFVASELQMMTGESINRLPTSEIITYVKLKYPNLLTGKM